MDIRFTNIPLTLFKDLNNILLSWDNLIPDYKNPQRFILFVKIKENWNHLYCGSKTEYLVRNLEPSRCYTFQLKIYNGEDELDEIKFKASTDVEPYYVFHISRALIQAKPSLLRKVVNQRQILLELENKQNKTPLGLIAEIGDLSIASLLITLGANVNTPLMWVQRTPLMMALFNGHLQIASLLLDKGASISLKDCNGLTAMHYAIDSGQIGNVQFAVEHGFDINIPDNKGWTSLLRAVIMGCSDTIIRYLIVNGADLNVKDKNGFDFNKHCELSGRNINFDILSSPKLEFKKN